MKSHKQLNPLFLGDAGEEVGLVLHLARSAGGGEVEELRMAAGAHGGVEAREQRRLAGVGAEGANLGFDVLGDVDDGGGRRERDRLAVGQGEQRRDTKSQRK